MTAYLQPGDKVIMALPYNAWGDQQEQANQASEEARRAMSIEGIEVIWTSLNPHLHAPSVVAVIREVAK